MSNYELDASALEEFTSVDTGDSTIGTTETTPSEPQKFKYQANGKEIEEDIDTILQRASQGFNYAQHMQDFKSQKEAFEQEKNAINQTRSKWEQYDKYATENPEWADHIKQGWENRLNKVSEAAEDGTALPDEVRRELDELKQFKSKYEQDVKLRQEAEEDAILAKQFDELSKDYPDYDLKHTDPKTGMSLEMQILEHARANGIHSVRAAFRDLKYDDLLAKQVTSAKEATAKELAGRTKKGFLAESTDSLIQKTISPKSKGLGYLDGIMSGAQELGINI